MLVTSLIAVIIGAQSELGIIVAGEAETAALYIFFPA